MRKEVILSLKIIAYNLLFLASLPIISSVLLGRNLMQNVYIFLKGWVSSDFYLLWAILLILSLLTRFIIFVYKKHYSKNQIYKFLYVSVFFILTFLVIYAMVVMLPLAWLIIIFDDKDSPYNLVSMHFAYVAPYVGPSLSFLLTYYFIRYLLVSEKSKKFMKMRKFINARFADRVFHSAFSLKFFGIFQKFSSIVIITIILLLIKISVIIIDGMGYISYQAKHYFSNVSLPELKIYNGVKFANRWSDLFLVIDSEGKLNLDNTEFTFDDLAGLFVKIHDEFLNDELYASVEFRKRSYWFEKDSKLIMIVDRNCAMSNVNRVLNLAHRHSINNIVFVTK